MPWPIDIISETVDTVVADIHVRITSIEDFQIGIRQFIETADKGRLYNIIIYSDLILDDSFLIKTVKEYETDNFFRRLNVFNSFAEGSQFHFFQVTDKMKGYIDVSDKYSFVTPVFLVNQDSLEEVLRNDFNDIPLIIEDGIYPEIKEFLVSGYNENPEYVAFKDENDMQDFYNEIGADVVRFPFNFGIKKLQ